MSDSTGDSYDGVDRRLSSRRRVTKHVDVTVQVGTLGLGPNIGIALIDISEEGLGVHLKTPVKPGDAVEVDLSFPVASKTWKLFGDVCWCNPGRFGTFVAGIRLRRRLTHHEVSEFA